MIYAVIDTNVVVSALLSGLQTNTAPAKTLEYALFGKVIPVYNDEIIDEYLEVLNRPKFRFDKRLVNIVVSHIIRTGICSDRFPSDEFLSDKDDIVFYEVTLSQLQKDEHTYLVSGNLKHFPSKTFVVSPREFTEIVEKQY